MSQPIPIRDFSRALYDACSQDTSADPAGWSSGNPTWGHCAAAALVIQSYYGGELMRGSLKNDHLFSKMGSHYWNELPDGESHDATRDQFACLVPTIEDVRVRARSELLANENTAARFRLLSFRTMARLHPGNALFRDENEPFARCYLEALKSPCQKMRFGACLWHPDASEILAHNRPIEPLAHVCKPQCIRLGIKSRTQSMLGACGHAEEHAMAEATRLGIALKGARISILGVRMNGMPWLKERAEHTCLRCATQMHLHGIAGILVPVKDSWVEISTEAALHTANEYAMADFTPMLP